jgi:predicted nucleotidyltransferase component of viral defense system
VPNIKLSKLQKDILKFFGKHSFGKNFYWTGGTLLSCKYLHHRDSIDLDFFSEELFSDDEYLKFINDLKVAIGVKKAKFNLDKNRRIYLIKRGKESVKLELVYFPFRPIEKKNSLKEFSLEVDSLTDIMVNKILSAYQREEPKDVYDLYCYLSRKPKCSLQKLVGLVEKKFGVEIETTLLLAKINELANDLDSIQPLLLAPEKNLSKKAKNFFQEIFNSVAKKYLK